MHRRVRPSSPSLGVIVVSALLASLAGAAQSAAPTRAERALAAAEDQLLQAEAKHDVAAIALGFADEAVFVHANGNTETKADFIMAAQARPGNGTITAEDRVVMVSGNIGVTRGKLFVGMGETRLPGLYLGVYVKRAGRWQLLSWQTSPAPRPPAPPTNK